ncbi:hypothetical protein D9757_013156 [Collybiopsis confluens]|uniref:Uncharacterized protein n=1 Tax=Collybiopsis confluens TaxID=2823264 RepID=A0A8H5DA15_9AGAR|nr:hypothetical protein D9757_013156 [Collybiopsis confluens]
MIHPVQGYALYDCSHKVCTPPCNEHINIASTSRPPIDVSVNPSQLCDCSDSSMVISSLIPSSVRVVVAGNASSFDMGTSECDPNGSRSALGILWSCLSVLFACTWVSVHANVPGPHQGSKGRLWIKIKLMFIALIAPELLVMWAARQWYAARRLAKGYKGWTETHAFFALMGGFALYEGTKHVSVLRFIPPKLRDQSSEEYEETKHRILDGFETSYSINLSFDGPSSGYAVIAPFDAAVAKNNFDDRSFAAHATFISEVRKEELADRNKSDSFAKFIAIGQTMWFIVQLCARWATRLPVTELEVMTLAFAMMNVSIYFFWWNKPQGVEFPIRIQSMQTDRKNIQISDDQGVSSPDKNTQFLTKVAAWIRRSRSSLHLQQLIQWNNNIDEAEYAQMATSKKISAFVRLLSTAPVKATLEAIIYNESRVPVVETSSEKVASFERTFSLEPKNGADNLIVYGTAMIFGAIHCIAWGSQFPSIREKALWQLYSLFVTFIPSYLALFHSIRVGIPGSTQSRWFYWLVILYFFMVPTYIIARIVLLVLGFVALQALPPASLEAVSWTNILPHI